MRRDVVPSRQFLIIKPTEPGKRRRPFIPIWARAPRRPEYQAAGNHW